MPTDSRVLLAQAVTALGELLSGDALAGVSDAERLDVLVTAGVVLRRVEAVIVETLATTDSVDFAHAAGCRSVNELLQRTLRVDPAGATRIGKVADLMRREVSLVSGERLPARFPALRDAMLDGALTVAGMLAATGPVERIGHRITADDRLAADECLAETARGARDDTAADADMDSDDGSDTRGPAPTTTDLALLADALATLLDPDGEMPGDEPARRRGITIGRLRDGLRPIKGWLTPDVAAQAELIFDALNNPKGDGPPMPTGVRFTTTEVPVGTDPGLIGSACDPDAPDPFNTDPRAVLDDRTATQKRHDVLAAALTIAARHDSMPTLTGAAPTLVVTIDATDLLGGTFTPIDVPGPDTSSTTGPTPAATPTDAEPGSSIVSRPRGRARASVSGAPGSLPASVAAHIGCTGTIQRVVLDHGRIVSIHHTGRVFTVHQRRAIIARDRECLIPGCHVPASWCEIHHVTDHARGGPTHTDNGVPLCWWHHRSLPTSGWEIRMNTGRPEIRGPAWWDPTGRWHTPTHSRPNLGIGERRTRRYEAESGLSSAGAAPGNAPKFGGGVVEQSAPDRSAKRADLARAG